MANTSGNTVSIFSLLDALRRRKFIVIIPVILLTIGFSVFAHFQPDRYRATATIAAEQTTPPEYLKHVAPPPLDIRDHLWTVREVLFSDPVLEAAAKATKKFRDVEGPLTQQQLEQFRQELSSQPDFIKLDSEHTFFLTFDSHDPHEAMDVTNKLAEAFVTNASAKHEQKTVEAAKIIDDQLGALNKRIGGETQQINEKKTKAVRTLRDNVDDNYRGIESKKEQIQDRETKITEEQAKRASIEQLIGDLEAKGVKDQPMVHEKTPNEVKLDELKVHLTELQNRFTSQHPEVLATKQQITELEQKV